jgi:hypothetical protein
MLRCRKDAAAAAASMPPPPPQYRRRCRLCHRRHRRHHALLPATTHLRRSHHLLIVVFYAAFVIDETALPACTRILWGGLGVVDAPAADASPADGQIWPSSPPALCTTGGTRGGDDMAGVPSCDDVSIASAVDPECFFCDESWFSVDSTYSMVRMCKTQNLQSYDKRQEKNGGDGI